MSTFSASYDFTTKIISAFVCVPLLVLTLVFHSVFIGVLAICVVGLSHAYSPRGYVVSGESITVRRLIGNVNIPLQGVREARITTPDDMRFCMRLWGSGGLFGYYGRFSTAKLGRSTWYVTDRKNMVVVRTAATTVLFSPDDINGFLAAIGTVNPMPFEAASEPAGERRKPGFTALWIGAAATIGVAALCVLATAIRPVLQATR
jgi:hypothetical protein